MGAHTFLYRRTGGRLGHSIPGVRGKMLLLDHVGAKSGKKRYRARTDREIPLVILEPR